MKQLWILIQRAKWIVDILIIGSFMLLGGFLIMKKKVMGYVVGTSLLMGVNILYNGLIPLMVY